MERHDGAPRWSVAMERHDGAPRWSATMERHDGPSRPTGGVFQLARPVQAREAMLVMVALIVGGLLLAAALTRTLLKYLRVRRALRLLGPPSHPIESEAVTVEGVVNLKGRLATRIPAGSERPVRPVLGATSDLFESAQIVVDSERIVELGATTQVIVGSRERRIHGGGAVHHLDPGTRVRARGHLKLKAAETSRGYRDGAHVYRFDGSDSPTVVVATKGPRSRLTTALACLGLAAVFGTGIGIAVGNVQSACRAHVDHLLEKNDLLALDQVSCDDSLAQARIAFARGEFTKAHRRFAQASTGEASQRLPTVSEIQSAALAEDFETASALTHELVKAWYPGPLRSDKQRLLCIADAYASRANGGRRTGLLEKPDGDLWCHYLAADLEEGKEATMWQLQCDNDEHDTRRLLMLEAGHRNEVFSGIDPLDFYIEEYPVPALYNPTTWLAKRHIQLEGSVANSLDSGGGIISYELLAQAALFRAVVVDTAGALSFLKRLDRPGGDRTSYILGAIAAVYIGDREMVERMIQRGHHDANAAGYIRRSVLPLLDPREPDPPLSAPEEPWNAAIFAALQAHDAEAVAKAFTQGGRTYRYEALRVRAAFELSELEPLRRWLRKGFPAPDWDHGVLAAGLRLADQLALAELFGDTELANLLRPRVTAFAAAIALPHRSATPRNTDTTFVNALLERSQDQSQNVRR